MSIQSSDENIDIWAGYYYSYECAKTEDCDMKSDPPI